MADGILHLPMSTESKNPKTNLFYSVLAFTQHSALCFDSALVFKHSVLVFTQHSALCFDSALVFKHSVFAFTQHSALCFDSALVFIQSSALCLPVAKSGGAQLMTLRSLHNPSIRHAGEGRYPGSY
jgi:hypothetical protein